MYFVKYHIFELAILYYVFVQIVIPRRQRSFVFGKFSSSIYFEAEQDTPSNIIYQETFNKLNLLTVPNRLFELSERHVRAGLTHFV
ncbi:hypothetical protein BpHYR1_011233 [Brachionus plicatilis]|uniref:Uncharacterized protein n=1 Tax=Brachionus plicatilis TaxID=10195 RepID=A0A3M7SNW5_BRAPC|nr:hypothetical protein BpHYR1_011233 [Brachionus plicatilis]